MNRKGFTLIEVLAVIVILGIIFVVVAPNILNIYDDSKLKSEKIFLDRLSQTIDSYIKLNTDTISFNTSITGTKCTEYQKVNNKDVCKSDSSYSVSIDKAIISFQNLIDYKILTDDDFVNAGNKENVCKSTAEIEVYKDSDYVYCYKVNKGQLGCLTQEYQNSIDDSYAINTCVWE